MGKSFEQSETYSFAKNSVELTDSLDASQVLKFLSLLRCRKDELDSQTLTRLIAPKYGIVLFFARRTKNNFADAKGRKHVWNDNVLKVGKKPARANWRADIEAPPPACPFSAEDLWIVKHFTCKNRFLLETTARTVSFYFFYGCISSKIVPPAVHFVARKFSLGAVSANLDCGLAVWEFPKFGEENWRNNHGVWQNYFSRRRRVWPRQDASNIFILRSRVV